MNSKKISTLTALSVLLALQVSCQNSTSFTTTILSSKVYGYDTYELMPTSSCYGDFVNASYVPYNQSGSQNWTFVPVEGTNDTYYIRTFKPYSNCFAQLWTTYQCEKPNLYVSNITKDANETEWLIVRQNSTSEFFYIINRNWQGCARYLNIDRNFTPQAYSDIGNSLAYLWRLPGYKSGGEVTATISNVTYGDIVSQEVKFKTQNRYVLVNNRSTFSNTTHIYDCSYGSFEETWYYDEPIVNDTTVVAPTVLARRLDDNNPLTYFSHKSYPFSRSLSYNSYYGSDSSYPIPCINQEVRASPFTTLQVDVEAVEVHITREFQANYTLESQSGFSQWGIQGQQKTKNVIWIQTTKTISLLGDPQY